MNAVLRSRLHLLKKKKRNNELNCQMLIKGMALKLAKKLGTRPDLKPKKRSGAKQKLKPNLKTQLKIK
jgi:hypothetical protein